MSKVRALVFAVVALFALTAAQPAQRLRLRGTITAIANNLLQVQTREGAEATVRLTPETRIQLLIPMRLQDVRQGSFVGVTAIQHGPGTPLQAREVHIFAESQRGTGEGHYPWDLEPGSSMTNANVDAIVSTNNGEELTLRYKGGSQQIVVTGDIPIVAFRPADRSVLKAGEAVFCIAERAADGRLTAMHVSVGEHGMKPPM